MECELRTRDLIWDSGAVLNQLGCQFIYALVILWVRNIPWKDEYRTVVGRHTDITDLLVEVIYVFIY